MGKMLSVERVYRVILTMLHCAVTVVIWLAGILQSALMMIQGEKVHHLDDDVRYLSDNLKTVSKLPKHLTVNLSEEEPSLRDLANLVLWSAASGIPFLSFYDYKGKLKKYSDELYKEVNNINRISDLKVVWPQRETNHTNGYKRKITVFVLSLEDGQKKVVELTRVLTGKCARTNSCDTICENTVDKYLNVWPEPDLVLYCGTFCSTYGCPPWQLRVTEFINLPTHRNLSVKHYVHSLMVYSKCEQRFGK